MPVLTPPELSADERFVQAEEKHVYSLLCLACRGKGKIPKDRVMYIVACLIADQRAAEADLAALKDEALSQLRDLLAIVHRDGGHYTEEHGLKKSVEEAKQRATQYIAACDSALCMLAEGPDVLPSGEASRQAKKILIDALFRRDTNEG